MVNVMLYPCIVCSLFFLCVACLTGFVNCLVGQFAIYLGVVAIFNVMEVFIVLI